GRIGSEQAVQPLIECLHDKANNVRGSALTALSRIASEKPIAELSRVIYVLIENLEQEPRDRAESIVRMLLRSAFRSANLDMISDVIHVVSSHLPDSDVLCAPYLVTLEYLKSGREPSVIERQHPEMREAIELLVEVFDKGST
ncbi:MAG: HEAT repeat domain-containing protein, partial [bacterium]